MPILSWIVIGMLCVICATLLILAAFGMEKPLRRFITSAVQGLCALGLVNALGGITGVSLGFSWLIMGMSTVLGMPGVIGALTLSTIMNM